MRFKKPGTGGFSMIELVFSMMILGVVLIAFYGIFSLFQKSSAQSQSYSDTQQNSRAAVEFITEYLRQAGSGTDYVRGQRFVVHAGPYQCAINADIDNSQTIGGDPPLAAISRAHSPNKVPASGTTLYAPKLDYQSPAETVVLTVDSDNNGVVTTSDAADESEEDGPNPNLYVLKRVTYGFDGSGANDVRSTNLALVRGPGAYSNGTVPQPLFQYFYDHDENASTPQVLWGDADGDNKLSGSECYAVAEMPDTLLSRIRKIRVTVVSESDRYDKKHKDTDGYLNVSMNSEVYVRNSTRSGSVIYGQVYHDANGDGIMDANEAGLSNVKVQLVGTSRETRTNSFGVYYIPVSPGDYAVRETDPPGYSSTTPNSMSAKVASGDNVRVDFGDQSGGAIGFIRGQVYEDINLDGVPSGGEPGIPDVMMSLDTGEQTKTNDAGNFEFVVPLGSYTVVETDPEGYSSSTTNSLDAYLFNAGDSVIVNFGDSQLNLSGTLEGYVFEDDDLDGVRDGGEPGLSNVTLLVSSGDSTVTDAGGYYNFSLNPGVYSIRERDEPGYTSSTVNNYVGIIISPDTTVTRNFGDFLVNQNDYIEITIGNTERALSVEGADLMEDPNGDLDIIMGTPFSGNGGNMLVFHNKRRNANSALGALFDSSPTYTRDAGHNINTLTTFDFSGDGMNDVLTGVNYNTGDNIQIWNDDKKGALSTSPDLNYLSNGNTFVMDSKLADITGQGCQDLVVGLKTSVGTGGFQTFKCLGNGAYQSLQHISMAGPNGEYALGVVLAVDAGDVDMDGDVDVVVGTRTSDYFGYIDIYLNAGNGMVEWGSRYFGIGAVNDLKVIDMMEDDQGDPDILVGTSASAAYGYVVLWHNTKGEFGAPDSTGYLFPKNVTPNFPNDSVSQGGEVLSLAAERINPDIFPEVFYGTRASAFYTGDVYMMETFGTLPSQGRQLNTTGYIGEVVTMSLGDFNLDNWKDLVVGTRSSSTQGKLLVYFYDE
jgi:type II secretory pathway pseudopilin PulG